MEIREVESGKREIENRINWNKGEWDKEPDWGLYIYRDYECWINRNESLGNLCGYVAIPKSVINLEKDEWEEKLNAHGGITYCEEAHHKESNDKLTIVGFDCSHYRDVLPWDHLKNLKKDSYFYKMKITSEEKYRKTFGSDWFTYKNIEFVKNEIKSIVDQIIRVKEEHEARQSNTKRETEQV